MRPSPPSRLLDALVTAAFHSLSWLVSGWLIFMSAMARDQAFPVSGMVTFGIPWMLFGVGVSSALALLASRLRVLSWRPVLQVFAVVAGVCLGTLCFAAVIATLPPEIISEQDRTGLVILAALTLTAWAPSALFFAQMRRLQAMEHAALSARAEANETALRALRQQINSHLVFNALNSILVAIEENSPRAASMVLDLSQLLRGSLEALPAMGTLREELDRLELYARIERSRFENDLDITLDIPDSLRPLPCLPMLLQPLLENAIKHGFARATPPVRIEVRAQRRNTQLTVEVINDGRLNGLGVQAAKVESERGFGLRAIRHRLEEEYGMAGTLALSQDTREGRERVTATVAWPLENTPPLHDAGAAR